MVFAPVVITGGNFAQQPIDAVENCQGFGSAFCPQIPVIINPGSIDKQPGLQNANRAV